MPDPRQSEAVFAGLADLFAPFRHRLVVKRDDAGDLYLETPPSARYPDGFYFGAVKIGKRYVSFHLMPVYTHPDLLAAISPELRKRLQGKSCFNFTKLDAALVAELRNLTRAGFERYLQEGLVHGS